MDGLIPADPMVRIRSPKASKALPKFLTASEVDAVLSAPTNMCEYLTRRNQAILELLYAAGLRESEIIGARLADRYLVVRGKGDKERIAPFAQRLSLTQISPWLFAGCCAN